MIKYSFFRVQLILLVSLTTCVCVAAENENLSFTQIYPILKTHCAACHVDNGAATAAWTLNTMPTAKQYAQCTDSATPMLCTTYFKLTEGEYPWMMAGDLAESPPYVNACVPEESYHIGVSIPARLSDGECDLIKDWIMQGTPL